MKKQRSLPFGYKMKGGSIRKEKDEAQLVKRIYEMYENDSSLQAIADAMNKQPVSYSPASEKWNKHQIKRILENTKYANTDGYPAILNADTLTRVQQYYKEKNEEYQAPRANPEKCIWQRLECVECGGRVLRIGGRTQTLILQCSQCGQQIATHPEQFKTSLLEKLKSSLKEKCEDYTPTPEIMRMENEIIRMIEKTENEQIIRKLIFEAAAKRYEACPYPETKQPEITWQIYKDMVETAVISADEVQLKLKNNREERKNGSIGKECAGDPRKPDADTHWQTEERKGKSGGILSSQHR